MFLITKIIPYYYFKYKTLSVVTYVCFSPSNFLFSLAFANPSPAPNLYMPLSEAAKQGQEWGSKGRSSDVSPYPSPDLHLLELTVMSAQNLYPQFKKMKTYAVATMQEYPNEKLITQIDIKGETNPTWNDKFVLRVDGSFLRSETSTVDVTVFAVRKGIFCNKDCPLGCTRILVKTFLSPRAHQMVALQIRRPKTLHPHGILNVSISLLGRCSALAPSKHDHSGRRSVSLNAITSRSNSMRFELEHKIDEDIEHAISEQRRLMEYSEPQDRSLDQETERMALLSKLEIYRSDFGPTDKDELLRSDVGSDGEVLEKIIKKKTETYQRKSYDSARFWLCGCRAFDKVDKL